MKVMENFEEQNKKLIQDEIKKELLIDLIIESGFDIENIITRLEDYLAEEECEEEELDYEVDSEGFYQLKL